MSEYEKWMRRVGERANDVIDQLTRSNLLLSEHVDLASLEGILLTLSIAPHDITQDDLSLIYISRDGFRSLIATAHDLDESSELSIFRITAALDSLYVETDALLRSKDPVVEEAIRTVEGQKDSERLPITAEGAIGRTLVKQSDEVISRAMVSRNQISISVLQGHQVEVLNELEVNILRLSASAFAVKVLLNSSVVYDATVRFLNEGADRVLAHIRSIAVAMHDTFDSTDALVEAVDEVVVSGTRFVKLVGGLITGSLNRQPHHREVHLVARNFSTSPALLAGAKSEMRATLCGRHGTIVSVSPEGRTQIEKLDRTANILSVANLDHGKFAFGTDAGLMVWTPNYRNRDILWSSLSDKFIACVPQTYNGNETIVVASQDGGLRRYWMPGGHLTQLRDGLMLPRDIKNKVGRRIKALLKFGDNIVVAVDNKIVVLDGTFADVAEFILTGVVQAACIINDQQIVAVGQGMVTLINFHQGKFSQAHGVPDDAEYVAVTRLSETLIAVGTKRGLVRAIELSTGGELGEVDLGFEVRGLTVLGKLLIAYGGNWYREGKSLALLLWEDRLAQGGSPKPI